MAPTSLPDISSRFTFRNWTQGGYFYKEAAGELGVPGQVMKHRDEDAQDDLRGDSGEHAGHLIGIQFGAPGGVENMGLQNPNINTYAPRRLQEALRGHGASFYELEMKWRKKLLQKPPSRISVVVQDKYKVGENRPFARWVEWMETTPDNKKQPPQVERFGNFNSPQQMEARGQSPGRVTNNGKGGTLLRFKPRR
jgi:hypothetical protein